MFELAPVTLDSMQAGIRILEGHVKYHLNVCFNFANDFI